MRELEENQIVLCTVTKIVGTIVFVKLEEYNLEGTILFSEISPGRIRNIRDFAFPGKRIICKVIKKEKGLHLSLRRVKQKEVIEFNELHKREKSFNALLKTIIGKEKADEILNKIKDTHYLSDFLEEIKENPKKLEEYIEKDKAEKVSSILREKAEKKQVVLKRMFSLSNKEQAGIILVKSIIKRATENCKECEVSYIAAGKYIIKLQAKDLKKADNELKNVIDKIEECSAKEKCFFSEERIKKA